MLTCSTQYRGQRVNPGHPSHLLENSHVTMEPFQKMRKIQQIYARPARKSFLGCPQIPCFKFNF